MNKFSTSRSGDLLLWNGIISGLALLAWVLAPSFGYASDEVWRVLTFLILALFCTQVPTAVAAIALGYVTTYVWPIPAVAIILIVWAIASVMLSLESLSIGNVAGLGDLLLLIPAFTLFALLESVFQIPLGWAWGATIILFAIQTVWAFAAYRHDYAPKPA